MKDYPVLRFLDIFKNIFIHFGVDYSSMRKILQLKLLLDSRRVNTVFQDIGSDMEEDKNNYYKSLVLYLLMGSFMSIMLVIGDNYLVQMTFIFLMYMFFMMSSLLSDFSSVLLDLKDKEILLSKPIDDKTFNMAKLLHITLYTLMISMAMMAPSLIIGIFKRGFIFFIILLAEVIFINIFLVVITALIYLLVLKFFDGEKLKNIINYVQIILAIFISISYQLVGRVFDLMDLKAFDLNKWWSFTIVPTWFAAPFELIIKKNTSLNIIILSLMGLIIPIFLIYIYMKNMATFESYLQKLSHVGGSQRKENRLNKWMMDLICKTKEEKAFYSFIRNMMKNEREFKLKIYPGLGFSIIFPLIMLFNYSRGISYAELINSKAYFNIYFVAFFIPGLIQFVGHSKSYKAAWIYEVLPIKSYESVFKASIKAILVSLVTPVTLLISLVFLFIFKLKILPQILIVYLNLILASLIMFKIFKKDLPFSRDFQVSEKRNDFLTVMLATFSIGALSGLHYIFTLKSYGIIIYLGVQLISIKMMFMHFFDILPSD